MPELTLEESRALEKMEQTRGARMSREELRAAITGMEKLARDPDTSAKRRENYQQLIEVERIRLASMDRVESQENLPLWLRKVLGRTV